MPQDRRKLDQYHLITAMTGYPALCFHQRGPVSVALVVLTHLLPRPVTSKESRQPCCWLFGSFGFGVISELQCVKINYDCSAHPITFYYAIMQYNPFRKRG
ncbi:hypothetical protein BDV18DRAFT_152429 [Aspergillus unguis]